jgi:hypothetical protein
MTPARRRPRHLLLAIAVVVLTACHFDPPLISLSPSATPSSPTSSSSGASVLLTVETRGGECPNGPCGTRITIGVNGEVHQVLPSDADLGTIPKADMDALAAEIERANFPLIERRPFTGQCPTAFDGQETIYTFNLPTGAERIASCAVTIDQNHPLFLAVGAAMRTFTSEGS